MLRHASALLLASLAVNPVTAQDLYDLGVIRDFELTFEQADYWEQLKLNKAWKTYLAADLTVDGVVYPDVGVRLRGQSTFTAPGKKKPFKIKMDAFVPGQELYGYDSLRLNNGYTDPSFVREVVMSELLREYMPLAKRSYITLKINGEGWGPYINEQTKDKKWMGENFEDDLGNRYAASFGANFLWLGWDTNKYKPYYELKNDPGNNPYQDLVACCDVVNNVPTGSGLTDALLPVMNIDSMLWFFAGDNVFGNLDSYVGNSNNWYIVNDMRHGRVEFVNHDLNLSFGTYDGFGPTLEPDHNFGKQARPLVNRLMKHKEVREEYFAHMRTLNEEVFRWDVVGPLATKLQGMIDDLVKNDPKALYSYEDFKKNLTEPVQVPPFGWTANGLKPYTEDRHAFLLTHPKLDRPLVELAEIAVAPLEPDPTDSISVSARVVGTEPVAKVELRWRVVGPFQRIEMLDDGLSGDGDAGDGVYGASIPPQAAGARVDWFIVSKGDTLGTRDFEPAKAEWEPFTTEISFGGVGVRITEYMYSGDGGEFVELTNTSATPVDLTGWSLDDVSATPGTFDLTPAGVLQPGQSIVVSEADSGAFITDWGLSGVTVLGGNLLANLGRNDSILVFDANGTVQDKLTYGDEDIPGTVRAKGESAWGCEETLGKNDAYPWALSDVGDPQGSWASSGGDVGSPGSYLQVGCPGLGVDYCSSNANSTGQAAFLTASGSLGVADNALTLGVVGLPSFQVGYFLMSQTQGSVPGFGGSQGVLCLGGSIVRFDRHLLSTGAGSEVSFSPDLLDLPQDIVIQPGETWNFQLWYRDKNPSTTSNTSNGRSLTFE